MVSLKLKSDKKYGRYRRFSGVGTFGQFTFGQHTFGQLLHLGILHFVHFTFRQLIQFVNCDNGLKFGQLSYLKAWFPLSQLEYQLNKSANIGIQTSQQLKVSVSSQIQHGKLGSC